MWNLDKRERRQFLKQAALAVGASAFPFGRALAEDNAETVPIYIEPKLSAPLPYPFPDGVTVYDPSPLGYVAEERIMSGVAPIYAPVHEGDVTPAPTPPGVAPSPMGLALSAGDHSDQPAYNAADFSARRILSSGPYTTRMILYRPKDMSRFSGNVLIEFIHPANGGQTAMWQNTNRFLGWRGDVWIGISHPRTLPWLTYHKPERYAALHCMDATQIWGMVTDTARLVKAAGLGSPLSKRAQRCFLTGYSFTGLMTTTYAKRHHNVNRLANNAPVFDGYPIGTGFGPFPELDVPIMMGANQYAIYNDTNVLWPRTTPDAASLPVRRETDADGPMTRRRRYEITGYNHVPFPDLEAGSAIGFENSGAGSWACDYQAPPRAERNPNVVGRPVYEGMMRNIVDWIEHGIGPPRAPIIETSRGKPVLDEYGNARGGLRMPEITVPIAAYASGVGECSNYGWMVRFTPAKLRSLYGSWKNYLRLYGEATDKLLQARVIVPYRAEMMKIYAEETVPDF